MKRDFFEFERIEPMFGGGSRDWSVDIMRCISCFMVCLIHSTRTTIGYDITVSDSNIWLHNEVYSMIGAAPTVLFVMVSGIFFLSPERNVSTKRVWQKNVLKMTAIYIFWCLVYALYRIYITSPGEPLTWKLIFDNWVIQPTHLWYIPMIIGLYIICPILRPITATYDTRLFRYIVILFISAMVIWTIFNWPAFDSEGSRMRDVLGRLPMSLLCQFFFWMLFGWIAYTYRPSRPLRIVIYSLGIIAVIIGIRLNIYTWCQYEDAAFTSMTQKFGILQFFKNIAIFYFVVTVFRGRNFSKTVKSILRKWSDATLIIYLVHMLILYIMYDNDFLYSSGVSPWIGVWVYAIIAYLGGGVFALLFHGIMNPIKKTLSARKTRPQDTGDR